MNLDERTVRLSVSLESGPGEYSYPALIAARNGDLLLTYTWKHERIRFVRIPVRHPEIIGDGLGIISYHGAIVLASVAEDR